MEEDGRSPPVPFTTPRKSHRRLSCGPGPTQPHSSTRKPATRSSSVVVRRPAPNLQVQSPNSPAAAWNQDIQSTPVQPAAFNNLLKGELWVGYHRPSLINNRTSRRVSFELVQTQQQGAYQFVQVTRLWVQIQQRLSGRKTGRALGSVWRVAVGWHQARGSRSAFGLSIQEL